MAKTLLTQFKLKRGNATDWETKNPVLAEGEPGFELDTNKLKIGNGTDEYNDLPYISGGGSGGDSVWEAGTGVGSAQLKDSGGIARGNNSVAEGDGSFTGTEDPIEDWAEGKGAHAEGGNTTARGNYSHTEGNSTVTNNPYEHAEGHFNVSHYEEAIYPSAKNTIHSVGIGSNILSAKNAFEIMQNGDAYLYGVGGYDGTNVEAAQTLQSAIGSGGGGGAQPDWEQNNPTAADYIKNRPFYEEAGEAVVQEFSSEEVMVDEGILYLMSLTFIAPNAGETVSLYINEDTTPLVEGTLLSQTINSISVKYIGNLSLMGAGADTGETYLLLFMKESGADAGIYISIEEIGIVNTAKVKSTSIAYHTLDEKFIPELTGYVKKSPDIAPSNSTLAIGKNVYVDKRSHKNIIASDNITVIDAYNIDRWNTGLYYINKGESTIFGNVYLKDQNSIFIGTPWQTNYDTSPLDSITIENSVGYITFDKENLIDYELVYYLAPQLTQEEAEEYYSNFNFDVGCRYIETVNNKVKFRIDSFYPKSATEASFYGSAGVHYETGYYKELLNAYIEVIDTYKTQKGSLNFYLNSDLLSCGSQGNIVLGTNVGIADNYNYGNVVVGNNIVAHFDNSVLIGNDVSDLGDDDARYSVNIADKIRVKSDYNYNDLELPETRGIILESSTGSNKKFRITVNDSGELSATLIPEVLPS